VVGSMDLDEVLSQRDQIKDKRWASGT